jgi:hypothetical protein
MHRINISRCILLSLYKQIPHAKHERSVKLECRALAVQLSPYVLSFLFTVWQLRQELSNPRAHRESSPTAVGFPSMRDPHHEYDKRIVEHLIHNAVVTNADSAKPTGLSFQRTPHKRTLGQAIDGMHNTKPILLRNTSQFFGRAPLNPNRGAHS